MISDILQSITNHCVTKNQLKCISINKYMNDSIYIYSLEGTLGISKDILNQKKFNRLKKINCIHMLNICDINSLAFLSTTLEEIIMCENINGTIDVSLFPNATKIEHNKDIYPIVSYNRNNVKSNATTYTMKYYYPSSSSIRYLGNGYYGIQYSS